MENVTSIIIVLLVIYSFGAAHHVANKCRKYEDKTPLSLGQEQRQKSSPSDIHNLINYILQARDIGKLQNLYSVKKEQVPTNNAGIEFHVDEYPRVIRYSSNKRVKRNGYASQIHSTGHSYKGSGGYVVVIPGNNANGNEHAIDASDVANQAAGRAVAAAESIDAVANAAAKVARLEYTYKALRAAHKANTHAGGYGRKYYNEKYAIIAPTRNGGYGNSGVGSYGSVIGSLYGKDGYGEGRKSYGNSGIYNGKGYYVYENKGGGGYSGKGGGYEHDSNGYGRGGSHVRKVNGYHDSNDCSGGGGRYEGKDNGYYDGNVYGKGGVIYNGRGNANHDDNTYGGGDKTFGGKGSGYHDGNNYGGDGASYSGKSNSNHKGKSYGGRGENYRGEGNGYPNDKSYGKGDGSYGVKGGAYDGNIYGRGGIYGVKGNGHDYASSFRGGGTSYGGKSNKASYSGGSGYGSRRFHGGGGWYGERRGRYGYGGETYGRLARRYPWRDGGNWYRSGGYNGQGRNHRSGKRGYGVSG